MNITRHMLSRPPRWVIERAFNDAVSRRGTRRLVRACRRSNAVNAVLHEKAAVTADTLSLLALDNFDPAKADVTFVESLFDRLISEEF